MLKCRERFGLKAPHSMELTARFGSNSALVIVRRFFRTEAVAFFCAAAGLPPLRLDLP
jgi:hypothetical protein